MHKPSSSILTSLTEKLSNWVESFFSTFTHLVSSYPGKTNCYKKSTHGDPGKLRLIPDEVIFTDERETRQTMHRVNGLSDYRANQAETDGLGLDLTVH